MKIKLKLKTLTPVHIGNGEKISSYSDYIYDNGYVYYIDFDILEEYFMKQDNIDGLIDGFVDIVRKQANTNKKEKYRLRNFFEDNRLDYKDFSYNKLSANEEITEQINRAMCSGIKPYIPGSSIKGAIRTAFIYNFFARDKIDLSKILDCRNRRPYIGQEILGKFSQDIFKYLKVSDSTLLNKNDLEIIKTQREHFKKKADIPVNVEAIKAGKECELDISINFRKENLLIDEILREFYDNYSINDEKFLFDIINTYTKEFLEREITELRNENEEKFKDLINQNTVLLNEVEEYLKNKDGAVLRLGFGKTFFSNSISSKFDKNNIKRIRKAVFSSKDRNMHEYEPFPITRTIYCKNSEVKGELGWVRMKKL